jgi:hypothetical protein
MCLALQALAGSACAGSLQIPEGHPRIWFGDADRLQQARAHFASHPFVPVGSHERALRGVLTGNAGDCRAAIQSLLSWQPRQGPGGFRDDMRQDGGEMLLVFDWCFGQLDAAETATLVQRWNAYMDRELADDLGNSGDEANNYFWGRTRNLLMWGIASQGVNPRAQEFTDHVMHTRVDDWFSRWYGAFGRGGVFPEGSDYGVVMLSYPILPFATAADFGADPYARTPYFREALYALIYGSTPGPSSITGYYQGGASLFPFNDDEHFHGGGAINIRTYLGDFASHLGVHAPTGNARHARAWLAQSGAMASWIFRALGVDGDVADLESLPLDYYAPGAQVMDMRTSHDADAMQVHLQLGTPGGVSHRHWDAGGFQIWRKGRWLTRESTGYADRIVAYGQPSGSAHTIDVKEPPAHNTLLVQYRTTATWIGSGPHPIPPEGNPVTDQPRQLPRVRRLQHEPDFAYVATEYSGAYRNGLDTRADWPYADRVWREFLFVRPLQALVILDRTRGSSDSLRPFYLGPNWIWDGPHIGAPDVVRSFIAHFETRPTIAGNRVTATIGSQASQLVTLAPSNPAYRVVDEDVPADERAGQFRLELDDSGTVDSHFLHVFTGYDAGEAPMVVDVDESATGWVLTLSHPVRGTAVVGLNKGMDSIGGTIAVGDAAAQPLSHAVQGIHVGDDGPVWHREPIFADGFEHDVAATR